MSCLSASQIDLDSLPPEIRDNITYELRRQLEHHAERQRWKGLCDNGTDQEIIAAAEAEFGTPPPITLANRYDCVMPEQELFWPRIQSHPRRPVAMKGGIQCLIARFGWPHHHCANGWAFAVVQRALRMSKMTALTEREAEEFFDPLKREIERRYPTTYHFDRNFPPRNVGRDWRHPEWATAYIGGKLVYLTAQQYEHIASLQRIARKFDTLEVRKKAVREQLMERLAA